MNLDKKELRNIGLTVIQDNEVFISITFRVYPLAHTLAWLLTEHGLELYGCITDRDHTYSYTGTFRKTRK